MEVYASFVPRQVIRGAAAFRPAVLGSQELAEGRAGSMALCTPAVWVVPACTDSTRRELCSARPGRVIRPSVAAGRVLPLRGRAHHLRRAVDDVSAPGSRQLNVTVDTHRLAQRRGPRRLAGISR